MESGLNNDDIQGSILLSRITETILLMQDKLKIFHLIL